MTRRATTFRLDPAVRAGLEKLSALLRRSLNSLADEAIREYVHEHLSEMSDDLESTLENLRAARRDDPAFGRAIDEAVDAEAGTGADPAEGRVVSTSATRARLHALLDD